MHSGTRRFGATSFLLLMGAIVVSVAVAFAGSGWAILGGSSTDTMVLSGDASTTSTTTVVADSSVQNAVEMRLLPPVKHLDADSSWIVAVAQDSTLWTWGFVYSELAGLTPGPVITNGPACVSAVSEWATATAGGVAAYALKQDGSLWAWGRNANGQLGLGDKASRTAPERVATGTNWLQVSAGSSHALGIRSDGTLWAWGSNSYGQLAQVAITESLVPVQVMPGATFVSVVGAGDFSAAVRSDGVLFTWGNNDYGQRGNATTGSGSYPTPYQVAGSSWSRVFGSGADVSAVDSSGSLWVWGLNSNGQAGIGNTSPGNVTSPALISGPTNVTSVSWSTFNAAALCADGSTWVWGANWSSELGLGDQAIRTSPTPLMSGRSFDQAVCFGGGTLFRSGEWLLASGSNSAAGFGDVAAPSTSVPTTVGAGWQPYSATYPVTLASGDGTKTVSVMYRSTVPSTAVLSDAIVLDTAAPTGTLRVNGDESYTSDQVVVLDSNVTGATKMRVNAGSWVPFSRETTYALSAGDGLKTVSVEYADDAMNMLASSASITLDTVGPVGSLTLNEGVSLTRYRRVSVSVVATDPVKMRATTLPGWQSVALGGFTAGVRQDGSLWGAGAVSYLGDGMVSVPHTSFVPLIDDKSSPWSSLAVGNSHALGIRADGSLWSWGDNTYGQLGLGSTVAQSVAVRVGSVNTWSKVFAGPSCSFALRSDGSLWAWGRNSDGQLGLGNAMQQNAPVRVGLASDYFKDVAPGQYHTLAIKTTGSLWASGRNTSGAFGDGTTTPSTSFVRVGADSDWRSVAAGDSCSAATKGSGTLWTWGANAYGQLGDGTRAGHTSPVQVGTWTDWTAADLTATTAVALRADGSMWTWGYNAYGQLGDLTKTDKSAPRRVGARTDWVWAATSGNTSLAQDTSGRLWCWGYNDGRFGDASTLSSAHPVEGDWQPYSSALKTNLDAGDGAKSVGYLLADAVGQTVSVSDSINLDSSIPTGTMQVAEDALPSSTEITVTNTVAWAHQMRKGAPAVFVDGGVQHALMITADGVAWATGSNASSQLATLPATNSTFQRLDDRRKWKAAAGGLAHTLMLAQDGTLWACGSNTYGQLGFGYTGGTSTPLVQVGSASNWMSVSAGDNHSAAINADGTLYVWGRNSTYQLGTGNTTTYSSPTSRGGGYESVSAGGDFTVAVKTDGTLWAWGANGAGQLGNGLTTARTTPTQVGGGTNDWARVEAGTQHVVALKDNATLWAWGYSAWGQTTGTTNRLNPSMIGVGFTDFSAGYVSSAAIRSDGTLWSVGGDGTPVGGSVLRQIGFDDDWLDVSSGSGYSTLVRRDGTVWGFGGNGGGQLGVGAADALLRSVPVPAVLPGWEPRTGTYVQAPARVGEAIIWTGFRDEGGTAVYLSDGPSIKSVSPAAGTTTASERPTITVQLNDVVSNPATLTIDGLDISVAPDGTGKLLTLVPSFDLSDGAHEVTVTASAAGLGEFSYGWSFAVNRPAVLVATGVTPGIGGDSSKTADRSPTMWVDIEDNGEPTSFRMYRDSPVSWNEIPASNLRLVPKAGSPGDYRIEGWFDDRLLSSGVDRVVLILVDPVLGTQTLYSGNFSVNPLASGFMTATTLGWSSGDTLRDYQTSLPQLALQNIGSSYDIGAVRAYVDGAPMQTNIASGSGHSLVIEADVSAAAEGAHTLIIEAEDTNSADPEITYHTFSFVMPPPPPRIYHVRPSASVLVTDTTPLIVARAEDEDAAPISFEFSVDGGAVPATALEINGSGKRWEGRAQVTTPLSADATHTIVVVARDADGMATTSTPYAFRVVSGEPMAHFDARAQCTECHTTPLSVHPNDDIARTQGYPCNVECHATWGPPHYGATPGPIEDYRSYSAGFCSCHFEPDPGSYSAYAHWPTKNEQWCRYCHVKVARLNETGDVGTRYFAETPRHDVEGNLGVCGECHRGDLTIEHALRKDDVGQPLDCTTCHDSGDPDVAAAIAAGDATCAACHDGAGQHPHPAADVSGMATGEKQCSACHSADIVVEHSKATSAGHENTCDVCHAPGGPRSQIVGAWNLACDTSACHFAGSARTVHENYCLACHGTTQPDFATKKADFSAAGTVNRESVCKACHASGLVGTHPYHQAGSNCGAACHPEWGGTSLLSATPRYTDPTSAGSFATSGSKNTSVARLHEIHALRRWPADVASEKSACASCHAVAACSACHTGAIPATHGEHSSAGGAGLSAYAPWIGEMAYGVVGGDQTQRTAFTEPNQCASTSCHDVAGTAARQPRSVEDYNYAFGQNPDDPTGVNAAIASSGVWRYRANNRYTGGRMSYASAAATLTATVDGARVEILSEKDPYRGIGEVYIDGVLEGEFDGYSAVSATQMVVFSHDLTPGAHAVSVRWTGRGNPAARAKYVVVDAFRIAGAAPASIAPTCSSCHTTRVANHW